MDAPCYRAASGRRPIMMKSLKLVPFPSFRKPSFHLAFRLDTVHPAAVVEEDRRRQVDSEQADQLFHFSHWRVATGPARGHRRDVP